MEVLVNSPFYSDSCIIKPNVRNAQSCRDHPWQIFSNGIMLLSQHVTQRQRTCQMWYVVGSMEKGYKARIQQYCCRACKTRGVTQEKQLKYPNCANLWFIYNVIQALSKTKLLNVQKQRKGKNLREKAQSIQAYTKKDE